MPAPFLPGELDGATLALELAFGADPADGDPTRWTWVDVTSDVRSSDPIAVTLGRSDAASTSQPAKMSATLDNTGGRYSIGPRSPHYPHVRRNTPARVRIGGVADGLTVTDAANTYASTPSSTALDVTGDIDIRLELDPLTWRPDTWVMLAARYRWTGENRAWTVVLLESGAIEFGWSPDGTWDGRRVAASADVVPADAGRVALRITLDVDNGNGECVMSSYTADTLDGPWAPLGDPVVMSGATSITPADADLSVGAVYNGGPGIGGGAVLTGRVGGLVVLDGIDGPAVVDTDFTAPDPYARTFTDTTGHPWTLHGSATLAGGVLFFGYSTGWSPSWDTTGTVSTVELAAHGTLRRLNQRAKPVSSSLFRDLSRHGDVVAYWPLEDGERSPYFTSGRRNDPSVLYYDGEVDLADYDGFDASNPVPTIDAGTIGGTIPSYRGDTEQRVIALVKIPDDGVSAARTLLRAWTSAGEVSRWDYMINDVGELWVEGWQEHDDGTETRIINSITMPDIGDVTGLQLLISVHMRQQGSDTRWRIGALKPGVAYDYGVVGTLESNTFGRFVRASVGDTAGVGGLAAGHLAVLNNPEGESSFWDLAAAEESPIVAWAGETATDRIRRLCDEYNIPLAVTGLSNVAMGPQPIDTLVTLLRECETADRGVLYDGVGPGLAYITRWRRHNADPAVTVDAAAGELATDFEVLDDDQRTLNEVTAKQTDGMSVTVTDEHGPMGTRAIDVYDGEVELNLDDPGRLRDYASWLVHTGTVEGYRVPSVTCDMRATPHLASRWLDVGPSRRVDLTGAGDVFADLADTDIALLAEGTEVEVSPYRWRATARCSPFDPWRIARYDRGDRYGIVYCELVDPVDVGTDTSITVVSGWVDGFETDERRVEFASSTWSRDDSTANTGTWSYRSADIGDGETSDAVVVVPDRVRYLQFAYRVSSEPDFDFFRLIRDGEELLAVSGDASWDTGWLESDRIPVAPGQTLIFRYEKDGSSSAGDDCAWIDDLAWLADRGWTTKPESMPFDVDVGGARVRVTDVTAPAGGVQTMTIEATPVNGVERTIAAGATVRIADPAIASL